MLHAKRPTLTAASAGCYRQVPFFFVLEKDATASSNTSNTPQEMNNVAAALALSRPPPATMPPRSN